MFRVYRVPIVFAIKELCRDIASSRLLAWGDRIGAQRRQVRYRAEDAEGGAPLQVVTRARDDAVRMSEQSMDQNNLHRRDQSVHSLTG